MGVLGKLFERHASWQLNEGFATILRKYLLLTNTVSCGLMMGFGDILQQRNEHWKRIDSNKSTSSEQSATNNKNDIKTTVKNITTLFDIEKVDKEYEHDYARTRNMVLVGVAQGPVNHYFYAILDRTLPRKDGISIIRKTLADQLINSPTCLAIFFFGLGALENKRIEEIRNEVEMKFMDAWKIDWCFWPPIQLVNFLFIPLRYRVIYINTMMIIFDTFLSFMKYDAEYECGGSATNIQ